MNQAIRPILEELKAGLEALYGERLDRVILYGSQARGDAGPESDIDVLVVLKEPVDRWADTKRSTRLVTDLIVKHGVDISRTVRGAGEIDPARHFYHNVLREGIML